ncbi:MAG: M48 family metalloprotease [Deltaproteobacteria bacterium]|nr:M48 family metalloprotease [Deltaproteobacteria bacterium]
MTKTTLRFAGIISAAPLSKAGTVLSRLNLPYLSGLAAGMTEWCRGVVILCMPYASVAGRALVWSALLTFALGLVYALVRATAGLIKGHLAIKRLPLTDRDLSVRLIKDAVVRVAFTHGLLRPRIYISTGLINGLSREELKGVLLHEIHHRIHRDPLRFFLFAFVKDLFFYIPAAGWFEGEFRAAKENAADEFAVSRTRDRLGLASALLKVLLPHEGGTMPATASIKGGGTVEERIEGLIEGKGKRPRKIPRLTVFSSALVASFLFFVATLVLVTPSGLHADCRKNHCAMHSAAHHQGHLENQGAVPGMHCGRDIKG